jgi:hypothetical protein
MASAMVNVCITIAKTIVEISNNLKQNREDVARLANYAGRVKNMLESMIGLVGELLSSAGVKGGQGGSWRGAGPLFDLRSKRIPLRRLPLSLATFASRLKPL